MNRRTVCLIGLSFLVTVGCVEYSLSRSLAASAPIVVILSAEAASHRSKELAQNLDDIKIRLVPTRLTAALRRQQSNVAVNAAGTWRAFTVPGSGVFEVLIVEAVEQRKTYAVQGLPPLPRPFSNLVWVEGDKLSVDRWSNPHFGYRYLIDMQKMELADVVPISS